MRFPGVSAGDYLFTRKWHMSLSRFICSRPLDSQFSGTVRVLGLGSPPEEPR
jgi:hypothetical protein